MKLARSSSTNPPTATPTTSDVEGPLPPPPPEWDLGGEWPDGVDGDLPDDGVEGDLPPPPPDDGGEGVSEGGDGAAGVPAPGEEEGEGAEGIAGVEEDGAGGDAAGVAGGGTDGEEGGDAAGPAGPARAGRAPPGRTAAARTGSAAAGWSRWPAGPAAWSAPTSRPETPRCSGSGGGRCLAKTEP